MSIKSAVIVAAVLATAAVAERDYAAEFKAFKATHLKAYASEAEEQTRFTAFVQNMKRAETLQAANPHATFGATKFADMTEAEFSKRLLDTTFAKRVENKAFKEVEMPLEARLAARGTSVDWRAKGKVSPVKNQGSCGSCWAFSAVGNIESVWAINSFSGVLTPLSEQILVSCDTTDEGCNGGLMDDAYQWLIDNRRGQVPTEEAYPYTSGTGSNGECPSKDDLDNLTVGALITGYNHLAKSEDTLAAAVTVSPVAIALDATSFQTYTSGIVTNCISRQMNHGVLAVGFDDNNVPPYWIIKNSWGTNWGEAGYIRVAKGSNQCLLTSYSTTATTPR